MGEKTKYDLFIDELIALEKQVLLLLQRSEEVLAQKEVLEKKVKLLEDENEMLKLKLEEAESNLNLSKQTVLNETERAALKEKIDNLVEKIDYHMRS